jgi:hypothetical protein
MTPAEAQWAFFLRRAAQRRLQQREQQQPINLTVVVQNEPERPRETARVRHVLPSPG